MSVDDETFLAQAETELSEKRKRVLDEQRHVTEKVSELCRYIGFGIVAVCYAIFTSTSEFSTEALGTYKNALVVSASLAVLSILFDYLQFLCGYISVREALSNKDDDYKYKLRSPFYKSRFYFFYAKQIAVFISVLILLYTLFGKLCA